MGHGFHGELLVITRGYILKNQHLQTPLWQCDGELPELINSPNFLAIDPEIPR